MSKDEVSGPLGNRTDRPHAKDGWIVERRREGGDEGDPGKRGGRPGSGEHDRSEKDK